MVKKTLIFLFIVIFYTISLSENKNNETIQLIKNQDKRIIQIEKMNIVEYKAIENKYKEESLKIKENYLNMENQWKEEKRILDEKKDDVDGRWNILIIIIPFLGFTSLGGFLFFLYNLWKKVDDITVKQIDDKIGKIIEENKEKIREIINSEDYVKKLKETKNVCVLYEKEEENENLKKIIKGLKKIDYKKISETPVLEVKNYDLIIFNNEKGSVDLSSFADYIGENSKQVYFYYNLTSIRFSGGKDTNYSNSIFTVYPQLINTLIYQDLIKNLI